MPRLLPVLAAAVLLPLTFQPGSGQAPTPAHPPATLRSSLLAELHTTHDKAEWFTPLNAAVAGLTPEQAGWVPPNAAGQKDPDANHSVGMLAHHLWFWNARTLAKLKGEDPEKATAQPGGARYDGNNAETFNEFDALSWSQTVHELDSVMQGIEAWVEHAPDAQLSKFTPMLNAVSTHNAYHTGQILYVRKLQGSWDARNGVR